MTEPQETTSTSPGRRFRVLRGLLLAVGLVALVGLGAAAAVLDREVTAPDWLRDRIEARVAADLPGLQVGFDEISVVLRRDAQAEVHFRDISASDQGVDLGSVTQVSAVFDPLRLMRTGGGVRQISLSGAFVTLRRNEEGTLAIGFGDMLGGRGPAPGLPELIKTFDQAMDTPGLATLRAVTVDAVSLRYEDARARRGWTVDGGRLNLTREGDAVTLRGDFALLSGGADVAEVSLTASSRLGRQDLGFGLQVDNVSSGDFATQGAALAWLGSLRAPISGALRGRMFEDGSLGPLSATLQIGAGVVQPSDAARPIPFDSARTYFTYDPPSGSLRFTDISVASPTVTLRAEGRADLLDFAKGLPGRMVGQFVLADLTANPGGVFSMAQKIARAEVDVQLALAPFDLQIGRLRLDDPLLPLRAKGRLRVGDAGWHVDLDADVAQADVARITRLWPETLKPKTRTWFVENVLAGDLRDLRAALRLVPGQAPVISAQAAVQGARVRYARLLPVAEAVDGQLSFERNRLVAMVDKGQVAPPQGGVLDVSGSSFVIPDVRIPQPPAELELVAQGPVTAALSYLDQGKLQVMTKAGLPVDLAQGQITASGRLSMPLRRGLTPQDFDFDFVGEAKGVSSDRLIRGRALLARDLRVSARPGQVQIIAQGTLDDVPFDGTWTQPLGQPGAASRVAATVRLSDADARRFGVALPQGMISGQGQGQLDLTLRKGSPPDFSLTSDLRGLSGRLPAVGWSFASGQTGRLQVEGALGQPPRIDRLGIEAGGLSGEAQVSLTQAGKLAQISFETLRLGSWLQAPVRLVPRGGGLAIDLGGGRLDLRAAPFGQGAGGGGGSGEGGGLSVALDTLQVSDKIALRAFRGDFVRGRGLQGDFTASVNGAAPVRGQIVPDARGTALRLASDDAGRVMAAAGLLKNAQGGSMLLELAPTGETGTYDGTLKATGVRLQNAPALGALLDAMSIVGLMDQLQGQGIYFANVDADFRITPSQVILQRASATGPSMGLSLDGYFQMASGEMDFQGVLSPIYLINGIGSLLTRPGEGLVGFNFNIGGTAEAPKVRVNPFSVLTPGMFREIFRRPPPRVSQ